MQYVYTSYSRYDAYYALFRMFTTHPKIGTCLGFLMAKNIACNVCFLLGFSMYLFLTQMKQVCLL